MNLRLLTAPVALVTLLSACSAPDGGTAPRPEASPASAAIAPAASGEAACCGSAPAAEGACGNPDGACGSPDGACGNPDGACGSPEGASGSPDAACGACGEQAARGQGAPAAGEVAPALRRVPAEEVCMRANRHLGKPQRPAQIEGRTYFGCCAGCNAHLGTNAAARTAKDPVSGKEVDKASAVIGARPDGSIVYFESAETFAKAGGA